MKKLRLEAARRALPTVLGDRGQLVQVFQNLIGNGLKFVRDGVAPEVHVGVTSSKSTFTFSVRDNGIGIEPEYRDRVFRVFQRLHERGKYPGSGIGLAIAKKIVERHGGQIWLESELGRGTTFYFTIPV